MFNLVGSSLWADRAVARVYGLEIDANYLPVRVYTLDVDYSDVKVQVSRRRYQERTKVMGSGVTGRQQASSSYEASAETDPMARDSVPHALAFHAATRLLPT